MIYKPNPTVVHNQNISDDYRIDALLFDATTRWNYPEALGSLVTVSYSFMTSVPSYGGNVSKADSGFYALNQNQQDVVTSVINEISQQIAIKFVLSQDSNNVQIRYGDNDQTASSGYALPPNMTAAIGSLDYQSGGDIWIDHSADWVNGPTQGAGAWSTVLHETLHALGIKHPGNYNAGEADAAIDATTNILGVLEDNCDYSVMSYIDSPEAIAAGMTEGQVSRYNMGIYDLLALQYLYGRGNPNLGDTNYQVTDTWGTYLRTLDDASGINTIDASALTGAASINMNQGAFSSVGFYSNGKSAQNNLSVSYGTEIKNLVGTAYNDTIIGNEMANNIQAGEGNDTITGKAGNDVIDGGNGIDLAIFSGVKADYSLSTAHGIWTISRLASSETDSVTNIERLKFDNTYLALDLDGNAGITAKILGSVFGKDSVLNKNYVGIGLDYLDKGMSYTTLAGLALGAASLDNNDSIVSVLWKNVIGSTASAADKAPYIDMLKKGMEPGELVKLAAETSFNADNIHLIGLAQTGLEYTPV